MRTLTIHTTTTLSRIEGEVITGAAGLNSFQELLDSTFEYVKVINAENFQSLPMWLFEFYSKHSEVKENKEFYALDKYAACATLKTELYAEILENLGLAAARKIFGLSISKNINRNDVSLSDHSLGMLKIA